MFSAFSGLEHNAGFRLRTLQVYKRLLRDGHEAIMTYDPKYITSEDIVVFNSFGQTELGITNITKYCIHNYTENINGIEVLEATKKKCKVIVCSSSRLAEIQQELGYHSVHIADPYEDGRVFFKTAGDAKKKVVWCGNGGNAGWARMLRPIIERLGMEYVEISNLADSTIQWHPDTWLGHMSDCDMAICPQDHWNFPAKSNVKATTALALGLPVVCSNTQAYQEVAKVEPEHVRIADSLEDWERHLTYFRDTYSNEVGEKIKKEYSPENQYQKWLKVFNFLSL